MLIEEALFAHLKAHPGLSALVGTRIYPLVLPQNPTLPAVTYRRISSARDRPLNVARPRFQISCWAKTYQQAKAVAEQVRLALDGYSGVMGNIRAYALLQNDTDIYEPETGIYQVAVDVYIRHDE